MEQKLVKDVNHKALFSKLYFCIVFCGCYSQVLLSGILEKSPYILRKRSNTLYRLVLKPITWQFSLQLILLKPSKCSFFYFSFYAEERPKSLLLPQCITISCNNGTVRNRRKLYWKYMPCICRRRFKTQKCSCCQKEKLTISSDDVLFSNLMLWFKVLYWKEGEKKSIKSLLKVRSHLL